MADWERFRELTQQVEPPAFESMVRTAQAESRRSRLAAGVLAGLLLMCGGIAGVALLVNNDSLLQPVQEPTTPPTGPPDTVRALPGPDPGSDSVTLRAGRYRIPLTETLALDVDVPDDTASHMHGTFLAFDDFILKSEAAGEQYGVPRDPCTEQTIDSVGPTVEDLVDALTNLPVYRTTRPETVELGGAPGTYLQARIPATYDAAPCVEGVVKLPGNPDTAASGPPPYLGRWWILDVDGQRIVLQQNCWGCTTDQLDEGASMLQGITFTPTQ